MKHSLQAFIFLFINSLITYKKSRSSMRPTFLLSFCFCFVFSIQNLMEICSFNVILGDVLGRDRTTGHYRRADAWRNSRSGERGGQVDMRGQR